MALDDKPPLPTCNQYDDYINEDKILPLTRASQFLNSVTSFAGLIDRFDHPDLTLYYALTRKRASDVDTTTTPSERILYIAVFDHKERTTRVYTRGDTPNGFRAIASSIPAIDLEHGILETELGETVDIEHDPIVGVDGIRTLLEEHYQSIMGPYSTMAEERTYHIQNRWTMKRVDTMSAAHGAGASGGGVSTVKQSHEATSRDIWERDHQYLEQGQVERMLRMLYTRRGKGVEHYMALVMDDTRTISEGETVKRVDGVTGGEKEKEKAMGTTLFADESYAKVVDRAREWTERLFIDEWYWMEVLLVYEVERWEEQLLRRKHIVGGSPEKGRLTREWRGNCWKRLDANIRAMDARMDAAKTKANSNELEKWQDTRKNVHRAWQAVVNRFTEGETSSSPSMPLQHLESGLGGITSWWWPAEIEFDMERSNKQVEEMVSRLSWKISSFG